MKLATIDTGSSERIGWLDQADIVLLPHSCGDMVSLIENGLDLLNSIPAAELERVPTNSVRLLPPIRRFRRDVLCTGWNYWDHFEEGVGKRDGQEVARPDAPTFFTKAPNALTGANSSIPFDLNISTKWDYEGEIAIIIGREGYSIPENEAADYIFGYTLANDVSHRDLQRRHGGQWLKGKSIDKCTPMGPYLVTADEVDITKMTLETYVNGDRRQHAKTSQMAFTVEQLISELSFGMSLFPGDVLLTGTPSGIGMARNPAEFLKAGDEIIVRATGLGELKNVMKTV